MKKNVFRKITLVCLVVVAMFSVRLQAAKAGKQTSPGVTSTIADGPFQIQSDGTGSYTNGNGVQSVIQPIGDWVLDTDYSSLSTRYVNLDLGHFIPGSAPGGTDPIPPFTSKLVKARLITQCNLEEYGSHSMLLLATGANVPCGLVIGFSDGGNHYQVAMNPAGVNNYDETEPVSVTCDAGTDGQCSQWTILPWGGTGETSVGRLSQRTLVKGKYVYQKLGDFEFSFSISVKNP